MIPLEVVFLRAWFEDPEHQTHSMHRVSLQPAGLLLPQRLPDKTCWGEPRNLFFNKVLQSFWSSSKFMNFWSQDNQCSNAMPALQLSFLGDHPGPPPLSRCGISPELQHDLLQVTWLVSRWEDVIKQASWLPNQDMSPALQNEFRKEWHKPRTYSYKVTVKNA